MHGTDSRAHGGPGILPLQDHSKQTDLDQRAALIAWRIEERETAAGQLGHYRRVEGTVGDLIGGFVWEESTREIPAWSWVFPCQTLAGRGVGETVTSEGGLGASGAQGSQGKGGVASDGPGGNPNPGGPGGGNFQVGVLPDGEVNAGGGFAITPDGIGSHGGGGFFGAFPIAGGQVGGVQQVKFINRLGVFGIGISDVGIGSELTGEGLIGPAAGRNGIAESAGAAGQAGDIGFSGIGSGGLGDEGLLTILIPTRGRDWKADLRFRQLEVSSPRGWPSFPRRWHGITVQSTDEDTQIEYFHPTDPRIVLIDKGQFPACGSLVCDMSNSEPDLQRHARLHSMLRIIASPPGSPGGRNCVAWNLTTSGGGDTAGGWVIDNGQKAAENRRNDPRRGPTSGTPASEFRGASGAVRPGARGGLAAQGNQFGVVRGGGGTTSAGLIVAAASYQLGGCLHVGTPGDPHQIGTDGDGHPVNPLHLNVRSLFIDPTDVLNDGPLQISPDFRPGTRLDYPIETVFAWNGFAQSWDWQTWGAEEEPPYDEPPPDDPPPPPVEDPPDAPPTITPDSGPFRNQPPQGPFTPPPGSPPGRRPGGGGGSGASSSPLGAPGGRVQDAVSSLAHAPRFTRRWLEMQTAAQSFRAQRWGVGLPDMVGARQDPVLKVDVDLVSPTVLRLQSFARQGSGLGGDFVYTRERGTFPYPDGTADGGAWFLPPEVNGEDFGSGFLPDNRDISNSVLGIGPGVSLGFGTPNLETGGVVGSALTANTDGDVIVTDPDGDTFALDTGYRTILDTVVAGSADVVETGTIDLTDVEDVLIDIRWAGGGVGEFLFIFFNGDTGARVQITDGAFDVTNKTEDIHLSFKPATGVDRTMFISHQVLYDGAGAFDASAVGSVVTFANTADAITKISFNSDAADGIGDTSRFEIRVRKKAPIA